MSWKPDKEAHKIDKDKQRQKQQEKRQYWRQQKQTETKKKTTATEQETKTKQNKRRKCTLKQFCANIFEENVLFYLELSEDGLPLIISNLG